MEQTALILAVQPDSAQAHALRHALSERVQGKIVVVESTEAALSAIDQQVPDIILLHAFMVPAQEDYIIAYLRTLPKTDHVQTIAIPWFGSSSEPARPKRSILGGRKQQQESMSVVGCDPRLFAADVVGYLTQAHDIKQRIERSADDEPLGSERRGGHRWSPLEMPWVSSVELIVGDQTDQAELINVSTTGALVRTRVRPAAPTVKYLDLDPQSRPGLAFRLATGAEVRATGRVIRCQVGSLGSGPVWYDVAFRFDESIGLELPTVMPPVMPAAMPPTPLVGDSLIGDSIVPMAGVTSEERAHHVQQVLKHSVTLQNELFARLVAGGSVSNNLRHAVSELTTVNTALVEIRAMLRDARQTRRTDAEFVNLANRLAPQIRELHARRAEVVESLSPDDLVLIATQANRSPRLLLQSAA